MKITHLAVDNLFSFDHLKLDQINPNLTTIVGPNGSGKTNLSRLFSLVSIALDWVEERYPQMVTDPHSAQGILASYAAARYRGAAVGEPLRVELGIELTSAAECEQLTCFVQSAIISTVLSGRQQQDGPVLAEWAVEQVTPDKLDPLMRGTLVLEHPGSAHAPWQVWYEFRHDGTAYRWVLADHYSTHGIVTIDNGSEGSRYQLDLAYALFGIVSTGTPTPELPSPLPEFAFERMCPESGKEMQLLVQPANFHSDIEPHRRFGEIVGLTPSGTLPNRALSLASVLRLIVRRGIVVIGERLRGADMDGHPLPFGRYSLDQLSRMDGTTEPSQLPLRLFHLKNGDGSERQRFERICSMFEKLAPGHHLDLCFEVVVPSHIPTQPSVSTDADREATPVPDQEFAITVVIGEGSEDDTWELPVTLTGAGVWEALVLAEAVTDSDDRLVVLDEPALNLHPGWQRLFLAHIREAAGQFLIITHSPYLVPLEKPEDMASLVRLARRNGATVLQRYSITRDGATPDKQMELRILREFSLSADARSLLFAAGAILVEGDTELGALPLWFDKSQTAMKRGTPGQLQLGFYSVGGENNFTPFLTFLVALGIPWVIICDGGPFRVDKKENHIFQQVIEAGAGDGCLQDFVGKKLGDADPTFEEISSFGCNYGIFTLACGWARADKKNGVVNDESFEAFVEHVAPGKLAEAGAEVGSSKVRRGRWLAENVACPDLVDRLYGQVLDALRLGGTPAPAESLLEPDGTVVQ